MNNPAPIDLAPASYDPQTNAEYTAYCLGSDIDALSDMARDFRTRRHVTTLRSDLIQSYQKIAELLEELEN